MKVSELIERLKEMDPDLTVYTAYDSGDYWGTVAASEVSEVSEDSGVVYSEYHQKMRVAVESDDVDEIKEAVVIS